MGKKLPSTFEILIDKLTPSGEGLGFYQGRPVYVFGVAPGDSVLVKPLKVSRRETKAAIVDVLKASNFRRQPRENHFLSCGPFQILSEEKQFEHKKNSAREVFAKRCGLVPDVDVTIVESPQLWHYRNKMEFSFAEDENGNLTLAFFQRFRFNRHYCVDGCVIAHERINRCAEQVLGILKEKGISRGQLKNIVLRYSYHEDRCLAVLYVVDENFPVFDVEMENLAGWLIIYSDPQSPAAKTSRILHGRGRSFLEESLGGMRLKYFYDSFFQINPPAFEGLLNFLKENSVAGNTLVDIYAGVGTIGFCLAGRFAKVFLIESMASSLTAAWDNKSINGLTNVDILSGPAEKSPLKEKIFSADTLVVDPPRSGLHPKVLQVILDAVPKQFIYVSCNPLTQADDFARLKEKYSVRAWRLFDLYPQTPHVESVLILEKR